MNNEKFKEEMLEKYYSYGSMVVMKEEESSYKRNKEP